METKKEEEQLFLEEGSNVKSKLDWSHLNDLESLISEMNKGKKIRCVVFDTETSGVNYKKDHILELACVEVINFGLTGRTFHIYIKPRVFLTKKVQDLNHIKYDDFAKYWEYYNQDTKSQLQNFLDFVGEDSYLVAHNAPFDYYFLNSELKYWGLPEIPNQRFRCTLRIIKKLFKEEGIETPNQKLFTCCEYFKILVNENEGSYHNALFDTIMTSKLLIHLYKKIANINDYNYNYDDKNNKKNSYKQNIFKPRYNKFDNPENLNKKKEKKEFKKEEKIEKVEEKDNNININNNGKVENKVEKQKNNNEDEKEGVNEKKENKNNANEINEGKLNGVELNLLIKKLNKMIINEENKENKKDE